MLSWLRDLDRILRGEATRLSALRRGTIELQVGGVSVGVIILGMVYGACMGFFGLFRKTGPNTMQLLASTLKVPLLFFLTVLVTLPSLYVFNALVGSRLTLASVVRLLVATIAVTLAVLASFGLIVAFFSVSTTSYPFILLLNVAVFTIAGGIGLKFLLQTLHRLSVAQTPEAPAASVGATPQAVVLAPGEPTAIAPAAAGVPAPVLPAAVGEAPAPTESETPGEERRQTPERVSGSPPQPAEPAAPAPVAVPAPQLAAPPVVAPGAAPYAPQPAWAAGYRPVPAPTARPEPSGALDRLEGRVLGQNVKTIFRIWVVVFALVGAQMGWVLRPFIGSPDRPFAWFRTRESSFFEGVYWAMRHLFG